MYITTDEYKGSRSIKFLNRAHLIATLLGVALSIYIGMYLYGRETSAIELNLKTDLDDKVAALEHEILLNLEALYSLKGLFESSENVSLAEFNVSAVNILSRHQNIQALEWIPKVVHAERSTYEEEIRKEWPDFEITQREEQGGMIKASKRDVYFPVYYVEPLAGNKAAFGFDLASNEARFKTLEMSRDLDTALATQSVTLVQEMSKQKGFLIFIPVYTGQPSTIEKRRKNLKGFVLGVFRIGDMFNSAVDRTSVEGIKSILIDITSSREFLYANHSVEENTSGYQLDFIFEKKLSEFGGRQWLITAYPTDGYLAEHRSGLPYMATLFGVFFVLLGSAYTFAISKRTELIEQTVQQRTHDLNVAKEELEKLSLTDALTNIANRRRFDEHLEIEWKRAIREKTSLTLLLIDIDNFKLFNDTYGHIAGDECLKDVASSLKKSVNRPHDLVARYGGEEFAIILPNTENMLVPAEKCRGDIEQLNIPHENSSIAKYLTVSIGMAKISPNMESDRIEFISLADRALYRAKETGRNKVCFLE